MRNFSAKVVANAENEETSKNEKHSQLPSGVRNLMAGFDPGHEWPVLRWPLRESATTMPSAPQEHEVYISIASESCNQLLLFEITDPHGLVVRTGEHWKSWARLNSFDASHRRGGFPIVRRTNVRNSCSVNGFRR